MLAGDIVEAAMPELMFVSRIDIGVGAREVRDRDFHDCAVARDSMNLLHGGDHIVAMLDRIVGSHFLKQVVVERPWSRVQIMDDIGMNAGIEI